MRVSLTPGQILSEVGASADDVIFIETGLVCLLADEPIGGVQLAIVGSEGAVGLQELLTGCHVMLSRSVVHCAGTGLRAPMAQLSSLVPDLPGLQASARSALHELTQQIMQTAVWSARGSLMQRCSRWLLLAGDRLGSNDVPVTHDILSARLGVRRPGVTVATAALQAQGLIRTGRGRIRILDRQGLMAVAGLGQATAAAASRSASRRQELRWVGPDAAAAAFIRPAQGEVIPDGRHARKR